jgi:hypothetical protein
MNIYKHFLPNPKMPKAFARETTEIHVVWNNNWFTNTKKEAKIVHTNMLSCLQKPAMVFSFKYASSRSSSFSFT